MSKKSEVFLNRLAARPIFPWVPFQDLPRCQLSICCGAGVRLSYLCWVTSISISGTYQCAILLVNCTEHFNIKSWWNCYCAS